MERIIHFEQFYYTNYGQGMRFEGNSTGKARVASDLELLASNWMNQDLNEPVELVLYNSHLGCYAAAMTMPCTRIGDARTSYWIHAVVPDTKDSDGFMDCLSWPVQGYTAEVQLGQHLTAVDVKKMSYDLRAICLKYHLTGERLQNLLYMVWQTVCNESAPSSLCLTMGEGEIDYYTAAREIMAVVYHLLPKPYRMMADYRSKAGKEMNDVRFCFMASSQRSWQFAVDGSRQWKVRELPEEETEFLMQMSALFEQDPEAYEQLLEQLCRKTADDYEGMLWNYYLLRLKKSGRLPFSQETLLRIQPFLEEKMRQDESRRPLFCQCLHQIDTVNKERPFIQSLLEKYIAAAAGLSASWGRLREQSFEKNWQLLEQLSAGETDVVVSYLKWMADISESYCDDFVQYGRNRNKDYLMAWQGEPEAQPDNQPGDQSLHFVDLQKMKAKRGAGYQRRKKLSHESEENGPQREIDIKKHPNSAKETAGKCSDYAVWILAGSVGFLLGLIFAWFAGYGMLTLIIVILVVVLMAVMGYLYSSSGRNFDGD